MIARIWKGVVRVDDADVYADYIRETGFAEYAQTSGNRGAWMLGATRATAPSSSPRRCGDSVDAIRAFAGNDIEAAVLYPEDQRHLIGGESTVTHYQVVDQAEAPSGSGQGA
jgi:hypothetical protein